ncbi:MAG: phytanoyl-CoA dioxygenase family protein [Gemmatimonadetes bacterium]|nr:phytanoyl-CoA dioxygenase family protein [Gemmatimonadota bacterium]MYG85602.1 phytanoyl-CoA dioxygenase family protein [Gemmatimonadota bacterium]MYJ90439.1 phytanoyl-CoA dioxygenase family protein [Gemmatimonadota bacterium]
MTAVDRTKVGGHASPYPLSAEHVRRYRENGHVHLRGICTKEEIAAFRGALRSVTSDRFAGTARMADRTEDDFSQVFMQTFNLREAHEVVARFIQSPRLGRIAADLMGVDAVRIYYDKAMFKEPESWITPWHQDGPHWPLRSDHVLTMWIPLVDTTIDMGPPRFASGTHRDGVIGPRGIHRASESFFDDYVRSNRIPVVEEEIPAGDATLHSHWVVHGARANTSGRVREALGITFYEDGMVIDDSACSAENRPVIDANLGNRRPGQRADHPRNQVVFARSWTVL